MRGCCSFILLYSACFLCVLTQDRRVLQQHTPLLPCNGEQVTLLSEGLLQLGSGLKKEVVLTQERIASILKQMDVFNVSLENLFTDVIKITKLGQDLDEKTRNILLNDKTLQAVAELHKEMTTIQILGASLDRKIKPLERKMRRALNMRNKTDTFPNISRILSSIERQNTQIEELIQAVNIHQEQINSQEAQIEMLLQTVGSQNTRKKSKRPRDVRK